MDSLGKPNCEDAINRKWEIITLTSYILNVYLKARLKLSSIIEPYLIKSEFP